VLVFLVNTEKTGGKLVFFFFEGGVASVVFFAGEAEEAFIYRVLFLRLRLATNASDVLTTSSLAFVTTTFLFAGEELAIGVVLNVFYNAQWRRLCHSFSLSLCR